MGTVLHSGRLVNRLCNLLMKKTCCTWLKSSNVVGWTLEALMNVLVALRLGSIKIGIVVLANVTLTSIFVVVVIVTPRIKID